MYLTEIKTQATAEFFPPDIKQVFNFKKIWQMAGLYLMQDWAILQRI